MDLEFYPGEVIHADITVTTDSESDSFTYVSAGVGGPYGSLASDSLTADPGQTATASIDYTVVAGDGVSMVGASAVSSSGYTTFILDAVNLSCTPN
jgi:hypothetical protein